MLAVASFGAPVPLSSCCRLRNFRAVLRQDVEGHDNYSQTAPDDTFQVPGLAKLGATDFGNFIAGFGAGYQGHASTYIAVRAAGCFYGTMESMLGEDEHAAELRYLGDNATSVMFIDIGAGYGASYRKKRHPDSWSILW